MPVVVHLLGLAVFAQGTSEFMLSGLIPDIASDLHVSVPAAGVLTSAFAVGMIIGAPLAAALSRRWPRRRALLAFLALFLLAHVAGALTTAFPMLLATRAVAALCNAGFLAVALPTATGLVPPHAKGRVTAVLLGGTTLACAAGVPAGALLGDAYGWRAVFWAVAAVSVPALAGIARSVPRTPPVPARPHRPPHTAAPDTASAGREGGPPAGTGRHAPDDGVLGELRALRSPRLLRTLLLGALVNGGTFGVFTYLAPLATEVAAIPAGLVPGVLALFGAGAFAGVAAAGRLADTRPAVVLPAGGAALLAGWVVFAFAAGNPVAAAVLVLVQGALGFGVGSALVAQALYAADGAPTLGGSYATAALNVGAAAGPWLAGQAIAAGFGYRAPLWLGAVLVAAALALAVPGRRRRRSGRAACPDAASAGGG